MTDTSSFDQIATMASRVVDFTHHTTTAVAAIVLPIAAALHDSSATTIKKLSKQIASLRLDEYCSEQHRSHSRDRCYRYRPASHASNPSCCWYSTTFGDKAHCCRKPCSYSAITVSKLEKLTVNPDSMGHGSVRNLPFQNHAIFVTDHVSNCKFLIDKRLQCFQTLSVWFQVACHKSLAYTNLWASLNNC